MVVFRSSGACTGFVIGVARSKHSAPPELKRIWLRITEAHKDSVIRIRLKNQET
jgi:hypothetical protein